jgi:hypothetical protein
MRALLFFLVVGTVTSAGVPDKGLRYKPGPGADADPPVVTYATGASQGLGYAFTVTFNRAPAEEHCAHDCANATLFVDADDDKGTGLKLGKEPPETGADLALTIQGVDRDAEGASPAQVKVKLRLLPQTAGDNVGETLWEGSSIETPERVKVNGTKVVVMLDTSDPRLPHTPRMRLVYHPPGEVAVVGQVVGFGKAGKIQVVSAKKKKKDF